MPEERKQPACAECKEKKLRCVPGEDDGRRCLRCARLGKECRLPEVKRRERKVKLRGRVEQLESSYSEILSLLRRNLAAASSIGVGSDCPPRSVSDAQSPSTEVVSPSRVLSFSRPEPLAIGELRMEECEMLLNRYRRMSVTNYGYVIIPETCSAAALIQERPLLALAVFIVTSWRNHARQSALQDSFMKELGERYVIKSERSLDLLQALIVYFGWCHWYATPFGCQAYRQASMIATMAIELGITQRPTNMTQHEMIVGHASAFSQTTESVSTRFWSYEARRAYVGACHISTICLLLFRRPVLLAHTQYLEECASSLAEDPQYPSDAMLVHYVGSLRLAGQISSSFDHGSREKFGKIGDDKVQVLVKTLVKHLDDHHASLPAIMSDNGRLHREYHLARAHIHEVGLYGLLQGQTPSVTRISIIYECYTSSMKFLSEIVDTSLDGMADWTNMDWRSLNLAVMLCTKSSIILDTACCTAEASQRAAWLHNCLDTLCIRVKELHRQSGAPEAQDHYLKRLAGEWAAVKSYHQTCLQRGLLQPAAPTNANVTTTTNANVHATATAHQFFDHSVFEMDPFNDIFWPGLTDHDGVVE